MSIRMGAVALPEPCGFSEPVHIPPAARRIASPGEKVVAFAFASVFQADCGLVPAFESLPDVEFT
jgi:hypothetical protein